MPNEDGLWMGMVKISEKGQIVIPKAVRDMFHLEPGMNLLMMADVHRGIALMGEESYREFVETTLRGAPIEPVEDASGSTPKL